MSTPFLFLNTEHSREGFSAGWLCYFFFCDFRRSTSCIARHSLTCYVPTKLKEVEQLRSCPPPKQSRGHRCCKERHEGRELDVLSTSVCAPTENNKSRLKHASEASKLSGKLSSVKRSVSVTGIPHGFFATISMVYCYIRTSSTQVRHAPVRKKNTDTPLYREITLNGTKQQAIVRTGELTSAGLDKIQVGIRFSLSLSSR